MKVRGVSRIVLPVAMIVYSCDKPGAPNHIPTATEVFHLRSECAALGEKMKNDPPVGWFGLASELSRYDPGTNRCYVELRSASSTSLYDGQTGELLANTTFSPPVRSSGVKPGLVTLPTDEDAKYKAVTDLIERMMADDRAR